MGFIPIRSYPNGSLAHMDKGLLAEHGIVAVVQNEGVIGSDGLLGAAGNVCLAVLDKDVAAARTLLTPPPVADAGEVEDSMRCPRCRSEMISDYRPYLWMVIFLGPLAMPAWWIKRTTCHDCGHRWLREPTVVVAAKPKPIAGALPANAVRESLAANPYATPHVASAPTALDGGSEPPSGT